jgi:hypothetical protein
MNQLIKNINNLHSNIANDVWPDGWDRECPICHIVYHMTTQECGYALAHGWPKHCGVEMGDLKKEENESS